jgi:hypothetical protein
MKMRESVEVSHPEERKDIIEIDRERSESGAESSESNPNIVT